METKSHHKTESALNECLLFEIEINKSTSINVITQKNEAKSGEGKELKSLTDEKSFISITFLSRKTSFLKPRQEKWIKI
jgi:hypothetical protein